MYIDIYFWIGLYFFLFWTDITNQWFWEGDKIIGKQQHVANGSIVSYLKISKQPFWRTKGAHLQIAGDG